MPNAGVNGALGRSVGVGLGWGGEMGEDGLLAGDEGDAWGWEGHFGLCAMFSVFCLVGFVGGYRLLLICRGMPMPRAGLIAVVVRLLALGLMGGGRKEIADGVRERWSRAWHRPLFAPDFDRSEPNSMRETSRAVFFFEMA